MIRMGKGMGMGNGNEEMGMENENGNELLNYVLYFFYLHGMSQILYVPCSARATYVLY